MSTATTDAPETAIEITPEDLLDITDRPMPELIDGILLEREMGFETDGFAATLLVLLGIFNREKSSRVH